ncbi:hypothetical protein ZIOFF_064024 [Zingiber officinale]|uniref:Uncharacterized protein n=1 Tax=Zingiber officinale TaxID=94328 RepID=A0A8J5CF84_ZINOF|nr:hypothetical protein ZIOFF_064024 [Zingiber officinale]
MALPHSEVVLLAAKANDNAVRSCLLLYKWFPVSSTPIDGSRPIVGTPAEEVLICTGQGSFRAGIDRVLICTNFSIKRYSVTMKFTPLNLDQNLKQYWFSGFARMFA